LEDKTMDDKHEAENASEGDSVPNPEHTVHIYICAEAMPRDDMTPAQWIQRVTLLAEQVDDMAGALWMWATVNAPLLLQLPAFQAYVSGIGYTGRNIAATGRVQLKKLGVEPLDPLEGMREIVRLQLDKPDLSAELRDRLLKMLSDLSREASVPVTPDAEWPKGGFTIDED
jgi:hypothetical protein